MAAVQARRGLAKLSDQARAYLCRERDADGARIHRAAVAARRWRNPRGKGLRNHECADHVPTRAYLARLLYGSPGSGAYA
jgi:hypothetical protein